MVSDEAGPPPNLTAAQRAVVRHVDGFFAERPVELFRFSDGPIEERVPNFNEIRVSPTRTGRPWSDDPDDRVYGGA